MILKLNIKSPINKLITMVIEDKIIKDLSMTLTVEGILFAIALSMAELFDCICNKYGFSKVKYCVFTIYLRCSYLKH